MNIKATGKTLTSLLLLILMLTMICLIPACSSNKTAIDEKSLQEVDLAFISFHTPIMDEYPKALFQDSGGTYYVVVHKPKLYRTNDIEVLTEGIHYRLRLYKYRDMLEDPLFPQGCYKMICSINGHRVLVDYEENVYYSPDLNLTLNNVFLKKRGGKP